MQPSLLASYFTLAGDVNPFNTPAVSPIALRTRIEAAASAGFKGVGLHQDDLQHSRSTLSYLDIRHSLDDSGIQYCEIELLRDWFAPDDRRRAASVQWDCIFEAAEVIGAIHVKIAASGEPCAPERMAECFAWLCDRAADAGTSVALEITPFGQIASLRDGIALIEAGGRPNGGLLLDAWHIVRGGISLDAVARIPAHAIRFVELCDGPSTARGSYMEDTVNDRLQCGSGSFPLPAFLAAIAATGYAGPFGVEILSDANRRAPVMLAAMSAFGAASATLAAASAIHR